MSISRRSVQTSKDHQLNSHMPYHCCHSNIFSQYFLQPVSRSGQDLLSLIMFVYLLPVMELISLLLIFAGCIDRSHFLPSYFLFPVVPVFLQARMPNAHPILHLALSIFLKWLFRLWSTVHVYKAFFPLHLVL